MERDRPISIADVVFLCNTRIEGQYGKGDILTFDLYKSCPSLDDRCANLTVNNPTPTTTKPCGCDYFSPNDGIYAPKHVKIS